MSTGVGQLASDATVTAAPVRRVDPATWQFLVMLGCFALAFGLVCYDLAQPHGLYGLTEYDDGVYFASGLRLSEGLLPYRDYVLVQPPGMAVLMAPFGFLSHLIGAREALGAARVLTGVVTGLNAALVAFLLRRRGLFASAVGGGAMALYPSAWMADHTLMLEPWLVVLCLAGIACCFSGEGLASRRRILAGGVLLGLAGTVKVWAIVPVLVLFAVLFVRRERRSVPLVAGVALGFVGLCLPFFAFAPHGFVTDVITSQLSRQTVSPTTLSVRLSAYTGLAFSTGGLAKRPLGPNSPYPDLAAALLGGLLLAGSYLPLLRRRGSLLEAFLALCAIGTVAMTFLPQQFFTHYAYFTAPFLALGLGFGAGRLAGVAGSAISRTREGTRQPGPGHRRVLAVLGVGVIAGVVATVLPGDVAAEHFLMGRFPDDGPAIASVIPHGACVLTDSISQTVEADRADVTAPGCPAVIDATGTWIVADPANPPQREDHHPPPAALVAEWESYFAHATYVVLSGAHPFRVPFTSALRAYFAKHYRPIDTNTSLGIYRRIGS